jgi:hypothetical protein
MVRILSNIASIAMIFRMGGDGGGLGVGRAGATRRIAKTALINEPKLVLESDEHQREGVSVHNLDPDWVLSLGSGTQHDGRPRSILRVTVVRTGPPSAEDLPDVFGRYQLFEDSVRFIPHFPFDLGVTYRATFDPRELGRAELTEVQTLEFSLSGVPSALPTVKAIFPSSDRLPENLLRFYVWFSNPMQRGCFEDQIVLLGTDGQPAPDVLYRAPVELWDRSMQYLTILLDPGRLKRGVGPNRELGPPLKAGQEYTLAIGSGMIDLSGRRLAETIYKRFQVTEAVREHIAVEQWKIVPPVAKSRQPLMLEFPRPLDWAQLSHAVTVVLGEQSIDGRVSIDQCERRWSFTPTFDWACGCYQLRIAPSLEDVCGNGVIAAFDRPLRPDADFLGEVANPSLTFHLI